MRARGEWDGSMLIPPPNELPPASRHLCLQPSLNPGLSFLDCSNPKCADGLWHNQRGEWLAGLVPEARVPQLFKTCCNLCSSGTAGWRSPWEPREISSASARSALRIEITADGGMVARIPGQEMEGWVGGHSAPYQL